MEKTRYNLPSISYKGSISHDIHIHMSNPKSKSIGDKVYAHESLNAMGYTEINRSVLLYDDAFESILLTKENGEIKYISTPTHSKYIIYEDDVDNERYVPYCHHKTERTVTENCNPDGHDEITFTCLICGNKETIFNKE